MVCTMLNGEVLISQERPQQRLRQVFCASAILCRRRRWPKAPIQRLAFRGRPAPGRLPDDNALLRLHRPVVDVDGVDQAVEEGARGLIGTAADVQATGAGKHVHRKLCHPPKHAQMQAIR